MRFRKKNIDDRSAESSVTEQPQDPFYPTAYTSPAFQRKNTKGNLGIYLGMVACSVVFIVSAILLINYLGNIHSAENATAQLRVLYQPPEPTDNVHTTAATSAPDPVLPQATAYPVTERTSATVPVLAPDVTGADFLTAWPNKYPGNEQFFISERFRPLRQQNRDIVAWLTIDGVVDEPVFQRDNSYYLTHDATGKKNPTGALFLDENCDLRTVPMQILIHGHNMKEGAMFGSLKKYKVKDAAFYREHPYIHLDTLYESATYVIFAVADVNIIPGKPHYFPFWNQFSFSNYHDFHHYVSLIKEYSRYKTTIDVQPGER